MVTIWGSASFLGRKKKKSAPATVCIFKYPLSVTSRSRSDEFSLNLQSLVIFILFFIGFYSPLVLFSNENERYSTTLSTDFNSINSS